MVQYRSGRVKRGVNGTASYEHIILISIVSGRINERETINVKIATLLANFFNFNGDQLYHKKSASDCT
jgi:hypothetical protein